MFLIALLRLKDAIATSVFIYKMRQHDTIIYAAAFYSVSLYIAVARRPLLCDVHILLFSSFLGVAASHESIQCLVECRIFAHHYFADFTLGRNNYFGRITGYCIYHLYRLGRLCFRIAV